MFPLGSVLVPSAVLPLQLFEPRYLALIADVRHAEPPEFGVVLIERGSEVGGGDVRTTVGTVARVVRAEPAPDGRWGVVAVGVRRIRVEEWLPDAPYPRALVHDWSDASTDGTDGLGTAYEEVVALLRQALALSAELGDPVVPATVELSDDAVLGSYQVVALAPLGPADQQELLGVAGAGERIERAAGMLGDAVELLRARLAFGGDEPG